VKSRFSHPLLILFLALPLFVCTDGATKAGRINAIERELAATPALAADGFIFPVGPPDGRGYYNAQPFGVRNKRFGDNFHLGEDWNGRGGGNSDLGDPVHAVARGIVALVKRDHPGWGNVVIIAHRVPGAGGGRFVESVYGHLGEVLVKEGDAVRRGIKIGTIGNAGGLYYAHLHLELRPAVTLDIGGGYGDSLEGFLHPTEYIRKHYYQQRR